MKVIFLDIDGVLNSSQFFKALYRETKKGGLIKEFCPIASSNLLEIISRVPEARIVISSSWRISNSLEELKKALETVGVSPDLVIDKTPDRSLKGQERGYEIQDWLDAHPEVEKFVIIDDSDDMVHLLPYLVKTTWMHGLLLADADEAIKKLDPRAKCMDCNADVSGSSNVPNRCQPCLYAALKKEGQK